ncbi:MAG: hypothetical protein NT037_13555 [Hyphomicrobiales bacterium]|nr:hypothetical protein [Hyphomicrobiales bacterium]
MSTLSLIGALVGAALGYVNASMLSGVVIRALQATDKSQTETERADYRARIRLFWLIVHLVLIGGGSVAGVGMANWLFG